MPVARHLLAILLLTLSFLPFSNAQSTAPITFVFGEIDFFGTGDIVLSELRSELPLHVGDSVPEPEIQARITDLKQKLTQLTGRPPTDTDLVCCDAKHNWTLYIGLGFGSLPATYSHRKRSGNASLPRAAQELYRNEMAALQPAVSSGNAGEDDSAGYTLNHDPALRAIQLTMRHYAVGHSLRLRRVLVRSPNAEQRSAAAQLLGYALRSPEQMRALDRATRDENAEVRNNAIRALWVLARSSPTVAASIPPAGSIAMLNSGIWGDRNKASLLLASLTQSRNPQLLNAIRVAALPSLVEMARWSVPGHAEAALLMLGRIAGIDEETLRDLIDAAMSETIIAAAKG